MGIFLITLLNWNLFSTIQLEREISIYDLKGLSSNIKFRKSNPLIKRPFGSLASAS